MEDKFIREKVLAQMAAAEFQKANGIVMRTINLIFKNRWFKLSELITAVSSRNIEKESILDALDYLEGRKYIQARDVDSRLTVEVLEADEETTEIKLTSDGRLVNLGIIQDPGIEM